MLVAVAARIYVPLADGNFLLLSDLRSIVPTEPVPERALLKEHSFLRGLHQ